VEKGDAMNFAEYQRFALSTAGDPQLGNAILGLYGEVGEVADLYKKHLYQGHPRPADDLVIEELGDLLWYVALATQIEVPTADLEFPLNDELSSQKVMPYDIEVLCDSVSILTRGLRDESQFAFHNIVRQASDVLTSIQEISNAHGVTIEDVAQRNIDKLRRRYPDGFTISDSVNRGKQ
jgi:NTP pyrophosphatase (non-canonical NTP hydrolase)